jgi:hypothetical protein
MSGKDPHMGALLDRLQGSISGRHIDVRHVKVLCLRVLAWRAASGKAEGFTTGLAS